MLHPTRASKGALLLRLRIAALRVRTATTWWLLTLTVRIRAAVSGLGRSRTRTSWRERLAPATAGPLDPGAFTVFDWSRATVVDVHVLRHRIAVELQLEAGTITRVTGRGAWSARAPRLDIVRVIPFDGAYPEPGRLLMLPRGRALVRYVREQGHARRVPATPKVVERIEAGTWANVPLRTQPSVPSHRR